MELDSSLPLPMLVLEVGALPLVMCANKDQEVSFNYSQRS